MAGTRLPQDEVELRVQKCYELRFDNSRPFGVKDWLKYCHENYNDKSEQTYTLYWSQAGDKFKEGWKELLNKQLTPAVEEIIRLLADENPKVRADAAKMIFKYTGNEVEKIQADISVTEIRTEWN